MSNTLRACTCTLLSVCFGSTAFAHAIVGDRIFPATLAVEDPGVSDEGNIQFNRFKASEDGAPAAWESETSATISKRLTENFGMEVEGAWVDSGGTSGLDNFGIGAKYVFYKNPEHELMLSTGIDFDIGGTGAKHIGAESYSTITPALFFGKGMGDLPDSMDLLKPFAVTGQLGYSRPSRAFSTDPVSGDEERNAEAVEWGFTLQYSLPYLQQHVRDVGIPSVLSTAVPVVEFAFETPTGGDLTGHTIGTINPGIMFVGDKMQLGLEAQLPLNHDSGSDIGYMLQAHFYFDNLFPTSIGRPIW